MNKNHGIPKLKPKGKTSAITLFNGKEKDHPYTCIDEDLDVFHWKGYCLCCKGDKWYRQANLMEIKGLTLPKIYTRSSLLCYSCSYKVTVSIIAKASIYKFLE